MNRAFFEAVTGPHGALLLGALDERSLRSLNGHFPTFHHDGQLPPPLTGDGSEWRTWLIMAGRGFGKTRAGAEWVMSLVRGEVPTYPFVSSPSTARRAGAQDELQPLAEVETPISSARPHGISTGLDANGTLDNSNLRIALVAATIDEARSVMIEGPSGLLALARHKEIAEWSPSRHRLRFANGAEVILYSGAHGEGLRGPEHNYAWCDELAKWPQAESAWNNLQLGLRVGECPRALVTTTPKVSALLQRIRDAPDTVLTGGATRANPHLPFAFVSAMERQYAGTRLGRQELDGVMLTDVAGSLWPQELIARCRVTAFHIPFVSSPVETSFNGAQSNGVSTSLNTNGTSKHPPANFTRIVIGVDPPASANGTCGIVVCGRDAGDVAYVIADCSVSGASPETWARAVADAAERFGADRVVAESNQGGAMVRSVLLAASATLPVELAHAGQGKSARAEPVAALFENGRAFFAGHFVELEEQLSGLVAGGGYGGPGVSPDRADACVWALWALMLKPKTAPLRIRVL